VDLEEPEQQVLVVAVAVVRRFSTTQVDSSSLPELEVVLATMV
jgi:hypothetical protein